MNTDLPEQAAVCSCIWRQFMTPEIGMDPGIDWFWRAYFYRCKYEVLVMATNENLTEQTEKAWEEGSSPDLFWPEGSYVRKVNTDDFLLHELKGRYLWILIRISGAAVDSHFCIEGFRVEFPWTSFSGYLPEIYQEAGQNSFFERYMAVFQSMYEDLEQQVDHLPRILDYESTPDENLETLLTWTGKTYGAQNLERRRSVR